MDARFRIRTREGEEISPKSVEVFSELVRSGAVRPQDMVFDTLTGEWAPANVHPMVRLFRDPLVEGPTAEPPEPPVSDQDAIGPPSAPTDELVLDLVEAEEVSPEEEARAFMAKMEEERRSDPDQPPLSLEVPLVDPGSGVVEDLIPNSPGSGMPRDPAAPQAWTSGGGGGAESAPASPTDGGRREPPVAEGRAGVLTPKPVRTSLTDSRIRGRLNAAILGGAVVALTLSILWPPDGLLHDGSEGVVRVEGGSASTRSVPVTEEQTRSLALEAFLDNVELLRVELGVGEVPSVWLEGQYLADAGAYVEVREYWERYLAFVEAVRASEVTLYRGAYLGAAIDAGVSGPVRSLRLASAQEDFANSGRRREDVYRRAEELARAALALDDALLQMKGRVTYEPIGGPRVSADPVIEAAGTDEDAQLRLEGALDRVLRALDASEGAPTAGRAGAPTLLVMGLRRVEEGGGSPGQATHKPRPARLRGDGRFAAAALLGSISRRDGTRR